MPVTMDGRPLHPKLPPLAQLDDPFEGAVVDPMTPRRLGKPGQSREDVIGELKAHQAMTDGMRKTPHDPALLALRQQEVAPADDLGVSPEVLDTAKSITTELYAPEPGKVESNQVPGSPPLSPDVPPHVYDTARMLDDAPQRGTPEGMPDPMKDTFGETQAVVTPEFMQHRKKVLADDEAMAQELEDARAAKNQKITTDRDAGINRARGLEGIAKGLDKAGRSIPGVTGKVDTLQIPKSELMGGVEHNVKEAEDKVSGEETKLLEDYGIEVPPGMSRAELNKLFPGIIGVHKEGIRAEALAGRQAVGDARFAANEAGIERRHGENLAARGKSQERMEEVSNRVPNDDRKSIESYDYSLAQIPKIMKAAETANFGPVAGRWNEFARKIGLADADSVKTQADLSNLISEQAFGSGGKQLTEREIEFFNTQLPQVWDDPKAFNALLQGYTDRIKARRAEKLKGLDSAGFNTKGWQTDAGGGGMVKFKAKDGTMVEMPRAEAMQDQEAGEGAIVE